MIEVGDIVRPTAKALRSNGAQRRRGFDEDTLALVVRKGGDQMTLLVYELMGESCQGKWQAVIENWEKVDD